MDLSYTDPNYVPMYTLDGVNDAILEVPNLLYW